MSDFGDHDLLWLVKIFADNILLGERHRLACPEYLLGLIRTHWSGDVEKAFVIVMMVMPRVDVNVNQFWMMALINIYCQINNFAKIKQSFQFMSYHSSDYYDNSCDKHSPNQPFCWNPLSFQLHREVPAYPGSGEVESSGKSFVGWYRRHSQIGQCLNLRSVNV